MMNESGPISQNYFSEGDQTYESEVEDSDDDMSDINAGFAPGGLIMDRDSMPNLGPNMAREIRQNRKH